MLIGLLFCAQVSAVLSELHAIVRQIVVTACEDTLSQHGFVPDPLEDPEAEGMHVFWRRSVCRLDLPFWPGIQSF